ncbi:MAG TPA: ABC transporter ATP-binding protein [Candidatus Limnocylindria bacterium]|nr:ABC transporter ATP-binding protein [Candidatus Limnocylindria bacterium]
MTVADRSAPDRWAPGGGAMVVAETLVRDYPSGDSVIHALRSVSFTVHRGELMAVKGRSGSGKTTLLNLLGGLDKPTSGRVLVDGDEVSTMSESRLVDFRRHTVAFIFQAFGLVPILSAAENVEIPLRLVRANPSERDDRVMELLDLVHLGERANHRPHELSGGEQQRVAIARALANRPKLLLADEPTGQLDSTTGHAIMATLRQVVRAEGVTAIVATHDPALLDLADRILEIQDGRIREMEPVAATS